MLLYRKSWFKILISSILAIGFIIGIYYYSNENYPNKNMKNIMYISFNDFGKSLEDFNDTISKIIVLKNYEKLEDGRYIDTSQVSGFVMSLHKACKYSEINNNFKYTDMYLFNVNNTIDNILNDKTLSIEEERYLMTLYRYNEELIKEYKKILEGGYEQKNHVDAKAVENRIIKTYMGYTKMAEELLNEEEFRGLENYKGKFPSAITFEEVEAYCKDIFKKLDIKKELKYNNKEEKNLDKYIFRTHREEEIYNDSIETQYTIKYDKNTNKIYVQPVKFTTMGKSIKYKENQLDAMAEKMMDSFNKKAVNYEKEVIYDKNYGIDRIKYSFIEKIDGVYDENKKINLTLEGNKLISYFSTSYPMDKPIPVPSIKEKDISKKLDKNGEIEEILTISNPEGNIEYEAHIKYGNTEYAAVFNGESFELKYYGRELRKYR